MTASAAEQVGSDDDFLFLAGDELELELPVATVWSLVEGDHQERFLRALSPRFLARDIVEELGDGYRCSTVSRVRFGRRRAFGSVVWLDEPNRSVELQTGNRTELRYTMSYDERAGRTVVRCEQAYRARSARFDSGAAVSALQQRATTVVADRLRAVARLVG